MSIIIFLTIIIFTIYVYLNADDGQEYKILIAYAMFQAIGIVLLHLDYYYKNRNAVLINNNTEFVYSDRNKNIKFHTDDIMRIEYHQNKSNRFNRLPFFSWYLYNFTKIVLKNKQEIYITCLMEDKFDIEEVHDYFKVFCPRFFATTLFYSKIIQSDHEFD